MKNEGLSRIEGNQADGEEQNGGEEDGYGAYFSHVNTPNGSIKRQAANHNELNFMIGHCLK